MPYPEAIRQPAAPGADTRCKHSAPVIVYGALRSGTTLLRLMMNAHPDLNNPGEVDFLADHIRPAPDAPTGWRYDVAALRADRMFRAQQIEIPDGVDGLDLTHALLQRLAAKKARGLLCLSMHRDLPMAVELFPGARVIHLLRDPRDVARSSVVMGWAGTLYHGCDHWVRSELDWDRTRAFLRPEDWVELRFEALMGAPRAELSRICDFLGVAYSSKMLGYPEHSTYAAPDPNIAHQWVRRCGRQDILDLESKIAPLMTARGYPPSAPPKPAPGPVRRAQLALRHRAGIWAFGVRNYGAVPFFGARLAGKLRLTGLQRHFQGRIDARITQMLR